MEIKMKEDEEERSLLQQKLDRMTVLITKAGAVAGVLTVLVLFVRIAVEFMQVRVQCLPAANDLSDGSAF
jgi:hypothetical protein